MFSKIKNHTIKSLSIVLSSLTLLSIGTPTMFAKSGRSSSINMQTKISVPRSLNISLDHQLARRDFFRKYVLRMPNEAVVEQLNYEIARYRNRAPGIFKIEKNLIEEFDPRGFLVTLTTLNYLFDKYKSFTEKFIEFKKKSCNRYFTLYTQKQYVVGNTLPLAETLGDMNGFAFNAHYLNYEEFDKKLKQNLVEACLLEQFSQRNNEQLYESITVHEFGHLITFFYAIEKSGLDLPKKSANDMCADITQVQELLMQNANGPEISHKQRLLEIVRGTQSCDTDWHLINLWFLKQNKRDEYLKILSENLTTPELKEKLKKFMDKNSKRTENEKKLIDCLDGVKTYKPEYPYLKTPLSYKTLLSYILSLRSIPPEKQGEYLNLVSKWCDQCKSSGLSNLSTESLAIIKQINEFEYNHGKLTQNEKNALKSLKSIAGLLNCEYKASDEMHDLPYFRMLSRNNQQNLIAFSQALVGRYSEYAVFHRELLSKVAKQKDDLSKNVDFNNTDECPMGTYGETSPHEFLAEAFAHLECSDRKKVSKLGKETEKFIVEEMKFLPKSESKFCKK